MSRAASRFGFQTCAKPRFEASRILARTDRTEFGHKFIKFVYLSQPYDAIRIFRRYGSGRREQWTTFRRIDPRSPRTAE